MGVLWVVGVNVLSFIFLGTKGYAVGSRRIQTLVNDGLIVVDEEKHPFRSTLKSAGKGLMEAAATPAMLAPIVDIESSLEATRSTNTRHIIS